MHTPSQCSKLALVVFISPPIVFEFWSPVLGARLRSMGVDTSRMLMPEAPAHLDDFLEPAGARCPVCQAARRRAAGIDTPSHGPVFAQSFPVTCPGFESGSCSPICVLASACPSRHLLPVVRLLDQPLQIPETCRSSVFVKAVPNELWSKVNGRSASSTRSTRS